MKIIIYGIGNNFIRNYHWLAENYEICGLVDSSLEKQGKKVEQYVVEDISCLESKIYDAILVTPNAHFEITQMLMKNGVPREKICYLSELQNLDHVEPELRIAFRLVGGMGDGLIGLNYIWHFHRKYEQYHMCFILELAPQRDGVRCFLEGNGMIREVKICTEEEADPRQYHLYIRLKRYPEVMYADKNGVSRLAPELIDYVLLCEKYKIFHPRFFSADFIADGGSALLEELDGGTRITQPDIYGLLGIGSEYRFPLSIFEKGLEKFGLTAGQYITVHQGCEERYYSVSGTKLWPQEYYNTLLLQLEQMYPFMPIVLVGAVHELERGILFHGMNLVGKTSLLELGALLKYAKIHIDTEGGCVHLRHALRGGPSVVLFGPTSEKFFGYPENANLRSNCCTYPCEWATSDWSRRCLKSGGRPECMERILPDEVMEAVKGFMECGNEEG